MLYGLLVAGYVLVCFTLLISVLLQQGKGGNMAAAFGGGGGQAAFGARQGATVLSKASAVLGALFMVGALGLAIIGQQGPGTVMRGTPPPASQPAPVDAEPLVEEPVFTQPEAVQPAEPQ
jgi:preprotein translocase subunit SecG